MVAVLVVGACSKPSAPSLLDRLPGGVTVAVGLNRVGAEADLAAGLRRLPLDQLGKTPPCALDLVAKLDTVAVAFEPSQPVRVTVAAHGAGLRPSLESCLVTAAGALGQPPFKVAQEGSVTGYRDDRGDTVYVLWLDDATLLAGPVTDAAATAALAHVDAPASRDAKLAPLLAHIHPTTSALWLVADLRTWDRAWLLPGGMRRPTEVWAELATRDLIAHVALPTAADADGLTASFKAGLAQLPPALQGIRVAQSGAEVELTVPAADLLAQVAGYPAKDLPPSLIAIGTLGIATAVAIPAFMKNARKAKTAEAVTNVKKIYDGARAYYEEAHQLPVAAPITPPLGTCCKAADQRCAPEPGLWVVPTWLAVYFSMDDPHRYSYELQTDATSFTARAYGDLDCNGVYSTFELSGRIQPDGTVGGGSDLSVTNELE
jgi:hypothetical protein